MTRCLVVPRIDLQGADHGLVEDHRRVGVDQVQRDAIVFDEIIAENELCHRDRVLGAFRRGDRAHERLVGIFDMAVDHVEMALVDRNIDRFADRATRRVHGRCHVGELHEIAEVFDRRIAADAFEVAHEGRAVDWREDGRLATDLYAALGIARMPGEDRRRGLQKLAAEALREMHPLAPNVGSCFLPQRQGFGVLTEFDADFLENRIGVALDQLQAFLVEDLVFADLAGDIGKRRTSTAAGARSTPCRGTPALAARPAAATTFFRLFRYFSHVPSSPAHVSAHLSSLCYQASASERFSMRQQVAQLGHALNRAPCWKTERAAFSPIVMNRRGNIWQNRRHAVI